MFKSLAFMSAFAVGGYASYQRSNMISSSDVMHADAVEKPKRKRNAFSGSYRPYVLGEIIDISHNTKIFRFQLDDEESEFNLRPCSTLQTRFRTGGGSMDTVQRLYTPVTKNGTKGYFDLIIKKLPNGRMTDYLFKMKVGQALEFRCIATNVEYKPNRWSNIGMIAGGVGFTPMLQVINHALTIDEDKTKLSFLFCNRTQEDILLKGYLDSLEKANPDRFKMHYAIDRPEDGWTGLVGHVNKDMITKTMPPPDKEKRNLVFLCGPDIMVHKVAGVPMSMLHTMSSGYALQPASPGLANLPVVGGYLGDLGYTNEHIFIF